MHKFSYFFKKILGILVSFTFLLVIFYFVPLKKILDSIMQAEASYLAISVLFVFINLFFRGFRWSLMFSPPYGVTAVSAFEPIILGLAINAMMPGKIGEIVRIFFGSKKLNLTITHSMITVIMERFLDALTLLVFLGLSFIIMGKGTGDIIIPIGEKIIDLEILKKLFQSLLIIVFLLFAGILLMFLVGGEHVIKVIKRVPVIGNRLSNPLSRIYKKGKIALEEFKTIKTIFYITSLSIIIWFSLCLTTYIISLGFENIEISILQSVVITSIAIAVSSIPSAPGAWGVYEAGSVFALKSLGIECELETCFAFSFVVHFCQYIPVVFFGLCVISKNDIGLDYINKLVTSFSKERF